MLLHLYLRNDTLFDLLRFRILDAYRPVADGVPFNNQTVYMDGLEQIGISSVAAVPPQTVPFTLNRATGATSVAPVAGVAPMQVPAVTLLVGGQMFVIAAADLPTVADPATGVFPRPPRFAVPLLGAGLALSVTVDPSGNPVLNAVMYQPPAGVDPSGPLWSSVSSLTSISVPLPLGGALGGIVPAGSPILNAGIAPTSDSEGFAVRLEISEPALPSPGARIAAWNAFFAGTQPSQLGIRSWAAEVPTTYLLQSASSQFDAQMQSADVEKIFSNYTPSSASWTWNQAQLTLWKDGVFESACAGIDIRARMTVTVGLSVPSGNVLRVSFHIDMDKDDWDSFKCAFFSFINPIAGIITAFDNKSLLPWYGAIGVALLSRVGVPIVMLALAFTNNAPLINFALKTIQDTLAKKGTSLVRTSDTDGYIDVSLDLGGLSTAAWLTLQEIAGVQDHVVLRGDYRPPDFGTPLQLQGTLTQGFDHWGKGKCSAPLLSAFRTNAQLDFAALNPLGHPVLHPVLALKCGFDPASGATRCWRFVGDPLGLFSRPDTLVHWTGAGIPGQFEVVIANPPQAYIDAPYPMQLQVFSSYGTRQFNVPPPAQPPKIPRTEQEQIAEAVARISECYAKSSIIGRIKALQALWAPNPPPDSKWAQHWQIQVDGLSREDRLRAWDVERQRLLAEVHAWGDGFAEISLVVDHEPVRVLQVTRNEQPMLTLEEYRLQSGQVAGHRETALNPIHVRQTSLLLIAEYPLPGEAEGIQILGSGSSLTLTAWHGHGAWQVTLQPRDFRTSMLSETTRHDGLRASLPAGTMRGVHRLVDGIRTFALLEPSGRTIGHFYTRPWFDRGSASGRYFARLNERGDGIQLYARCLPRDVEPQVGSVDPLLNPDGLRR